MIISFGINIIGETVNYWGGGEFGGTAVILKEAHAMKGSVYQENKFLSDSLRNGPYFLARGTSTSHLHKNRLVILRPYIYNERGSTLNSPGLHIKWEIVFQCWPKEDKNYVYIEKEIPGFHW